MFLGSVLIWGVAVYFDAKTDAADDRSAYTIPRQVYYEFTLQNTGSQLLENAEFRTYAPVKQTANQRCDAITASHPFDLSIDGLGNQILYFKLKALPPYATRIIRITADLRLSEGAKPNSPDAPALWLKAEKYIEADHPAIQSTARQLKSSDVLQTANNIFQWVAGHIQYAGYIKNDRGALYAHTYRKGDCTEYMYLFAALCRANAIPSRGVGGYICPENTILKVAGFHNWAEFYQDGAWHIADPQNRFFFKNTAGYIAMHIMGNQGDGAENRFNRFSYKGDGLKVSMN
ncbi:MAG: transglutaminase-like domain-containing protein [Desulfobacterales bacterium]|nr:transglutaminase-like domain-containing protein [Desulfobacterales bacterium]